MLLSEAMFRVSHVSIEFNVDFHKATTTVRERERERLNLIDHLSSYSFSSFLSSRIKVHG
jgi:hypothetical protein